MNRESLRRVSAVIRHDTATLRGMPSITVPMFAFPTLFILVVPVVMMLVAREPGRLPVLPQEAIAQMPGWLQHDLGAAAPEAGLVVLLTRAFCPLLLMIVPVMCSSIMAADSFAGERERGTLPYLMTTPVTRLELIAGKIGACLCLGLALTWLLALLLGAGVALWGPIGVAGLPSWTVWLVLFTAPGVGIFALGLTVVVSMLVDTFQAAYQWGPSAIAPVVVLIGLFFAEVLTPGLPAFLVIGVLFGVLGAVGVGGAARWVRRQV